MGCWFPPRLARVISLRRRKWLPSCRALRRPFAAISTCVFSANRIRRGTTLSRHLLSEIDALELPRLATTLSEAVAYGELGFAPSLAATGQAAIEIAALLAELHDLDWLALPAVAQVRV